MNQQQDQALNRFGLSCREARLSRPETTRNAPHWYCPYCGNPVEDEHSGCCKEVGHATQEDWS